MTMQSEYRKYAQECVRWAAEANSINERKIFLDMAKAWTSVALIERDVTRQSHFDGDRGASAGSFLRPNRYRAAARKDPHRPPLWGETSVH